MLLMAENGIRGGICQAIHMYAKANNKYMKIMIKHWIIISSVCRRKQLVWMGNVSKLLVDGFKWIEKKISRFNERFHKKLQ